MHDKKRRLAYSFRRGSRAMTITSATTAAAFYANLISPIMPIRAFGIFAITVVPFCFLITIFVQPLVYIVYETYIFKEPKSDGYFSSEKKVEEDEERGDGDVQVEPIDLETAKQKEEEDLKKY